MISATIAAEYIESQLGAAPPAVVVNAAREKVEAVEAAMLDAGYDEPTIVLLQCMAVAVLACPGAPRRIKSQGAPSGASRSFDYADGDLSALRRSIESMDTAGTLADLLGQDPAASALLLVTC